jgi:hypothetical protein
LELKELKRQEFEASNDAAAILLDSHFTNQLHELSDEALKQMQSLQNDIDGFDLYAYTSASDDCRDELFENDAAAIQFNSQLMNQLNQFYHIEDAEFKLSIITKRHLENSSLCIEIIF